LLYRVIDAFTRVYDHVEVGSSVRWGVTRIMIYEIIFADLGIRLSFSNFDVDQASFITELMTHL